MPHLATNPVHRTFLRPLDTPEDSARPTLTPGASAKIKASTLSEDARVGEIPNQTSLWDEKPWWCQPWSIVLTGLIAIGGSWWLLQKIWITGLVVLAIAAWWVLFLVLVPRAYREAQS
jgi:hypothetical protein